MLRLNTERKLYISGKKCKLSEERIRQLADLGFDFHRIPKSSVGEESNDGGKKLDVPELPWKTRLHQLKTFYDDVGHLNIDHNYRHCGNLGGWAVEMSIMHKNWKEGREGTYHYVYCINSILPQLLSSLPGLFGHSTSQCCGEV